MKMNKSLLIRIRRPGIIAYAAILTTTALALVGSPPNAPQGSGVTEIVPPSPQLSTQPGAASIEFPALKAEPSSPEQQGVPEKPAVSADVLRPAAILHHQSVTCSREVSVFNHGQSSDRRTVTSRELTVFNFPQAAHP